MGILQKMGLAPKRREGAPSIGEKKKKEQEAAANKKSLYFRWVIFLAFLALVVYSLPQTSFRQVESYSVGEPWRSDNLTAPFTFAPQKSDAEMEEERAQVRVNTPPIFHIDPDVRMETEDEIESVFNELQPVLDSYVQWQRSRQNPGVSSSNDSLRFIEEKEQTETGLSESSWETLLEDYASVRMDNGSRQFTGYTIRRLLHSVTSSLMDEGLINTSKESIESEEITLRDLDQRTERTISLNNAYDLSEARDYAERQLSRQLSAEHAAAGVDLFDRIIRANWLFSPSDTQIRLNEALSEISATKGAVAQGQVIIRKGDIVTEETANMLESLAEVRADTASEVERWLRFGGEFIVLIVTTLFFLFYLYLYRKKIFENSAMFLLVFLVLGIVVLTSGIVYGFEQISPYIVPVAIAPLILTIIFDSRVGLLATITLATITAIFHDNNFEYLIATIMACSFGVFSVRDINKRTQFFVTTPFVVLIGYVLIVSGFTLTRYGGMEQYVDQMMFIVINSVFILFTYPLILFFEKTFDITTDFTLLELADTNLPLLKDLMNHAPGTFHHSLQVANLAESAASSIGANALLCRVGGLYHDIGKMNKPSYFIENQSGRNEHDNLKPRMSALVIKAHVSDGVKMAEEHDLPETVIEFIRTHHGTSLIRYFYDKAKKSADKEDDIREEDFRYDGPIPQSKETGILLLADGVEAASRAMKDPTYSKLENLINRMVDDHVHEGQLNHCPLTFHQLDIIKKTFLNILLGVYHHRVEYPDEQKEEKKTLSAKEGSEIVKQPDLAAVPEPPDPDTSAQNSSGSGESGQDGSRE
ncbi:MAG: HDIG domain-containing metalloprotein [Balneolaceae bacterium]